MSVEMDKNFVTKDNAREYMDELIYELSNQLDENKDFGDWDACESIEGDIRTVEYVKKLINSYM